MKEIVPPYPIFVIVLNDIPFVVIATIPLCPTDTIGFPIVNDNNEVFVDNPLVGNQFNIGSLLSTDIVDIKTFGEIVDAYPIPPVEIAIEDIAFAIDTTAVAIPASVSLFSIINTFLSASSIKSISVNKGYALFTYIDVSVALKFLIILVVGLIVDIKLGLALETKEPRITLSSVCFVHFNGLNLSGFILIPILS